jgi:hypothetical protein
MPGRVGVHLEVIAGRVALSYTKDASPQPHDFLVRRGKVVDPQVEVDLLRR